MSTAVVPGRAAAFKQPFSGIGGNLRMDLRLDRWRILIWFLTITLTTWVTVVSLEEVYPDAQARQARADLMSNPSAVMMSGPAFGLDNYTLGVMTANEVGLSLMVAVAIMSILLVVRHTRAEEESGRLEMVRALPTGAYAPPTAALLTVALANVLVGAGVAAALLVPGLNPVDSVAFGAAVAVTGLVFGAVAAVTAQLSEHARAASGLALTVLGAAFLIRGLGDILRPTGSWLSWFSPIAWAQQTRPYVDLRWWPLLASLALIGVLLAVAVMLARRRDLGAGLRAVQPGPAHAARSLLSVSGLARRLLRGAFLGWVIGIGVFALAFGSLAGSIEDAFADTPLLAEFFRADAAAVTESFGATVLSFTLLAVIVFAASSVLRLRTEEESGRAALAIVSGVSRARWLAGWLTVIAVQVLIATVVSGFAVGAGMAVALEQTYWIADLTAASLVYLAAVFAVAGVTAALVGWAPSLTGLIWLLVAYIVFVGWIGPLLDLPEPAANISPIEATPLVPSEDLTAVPLVILTAIALAATGAAFAGYRRRNLLG